MDCMQMISRKCPGRHVKEGQQPQPVAVVLVFVLPLRMAWASVRIMLGTITILVEELNATWMHIVSEWIKKNVTSPSFVIILAHLVPLLK